MNEKQVNHEEYQEESAKELDKLRKENAALKKEIEFLKKVASYFARAVEED